MNPLIGSSLIGLGGAIIGGIGSSITNHQNVASQYEINQQQLAFAREQTEKEFQYNSISSQMKRALEAGVNPYLLAGAQPTSASASSTPNIDAPVRQNPFAHVPQASIGLANNILHAKQLELSDKQINNEIAKTTVADYQAKIELLKTLSQTLGDKELTSSEVQELVNSVFPTNNMSIPSLIRDSTITQELADRLRNSRVDADTKAYLFDWLDEFTYTQYMISTGQVDLQASQQALNKAMANKEDAKVKEIEQAIKNMEEEFKTLEFEGKLSQEKAKYVVDLAKATVDNLMSVASVNQQEAQYWVWKQVISNQQKYKFRFGPIGWENSRIFLPFGDNELYNSPTFNHSHPNK